MVYICLSTARNKKQTKDQAKKAMEDTLDRDRYCDDSCNCDDGLAPLCSKPFFGGNKMQTIRDYKRVRKENESVLSRPIKASEGGIWIGCADLFMTKKCTLWCPTCSCGLRALKEPSPQRRAGSIGAQSSRRNIGRNTATSKGDNQLRDDESAIIAEQTRKLKLACHCDKGNINSLKDWADLGDLKAYYGKSFDPETHPTHCECCMRPLPFKAVTDYLAQKLEKLNIV